MSAPRPGPPLRAPGTPELSGSQGPCRQRRLGTKWESPALAVALEGSLLLTCAPASPAESWWRPGGGHMNAFLGVKGSRVQIPPSRRFFERLYPSLGTNPAMIVPTWPRRDGQSTHGGHHRAAGCAYRESRPRL